MEIGEDNNEVDMNKKEKYIKIIKDGPYMVYGDIPLNKSTIIGDEDGNGVEWQISECYVIENEPYALCRCGHTSTPPFCDGHHSKVGFKDSNKPIDASEICEVTKVYNGGKIDLLDRKWLCVYARFCDIGINTWHYAIYSDENPGYEEEAIKQSQKCPSGRLTIRKDGKELEPELPEEISLIQDRPRDCRSSIWVKGGILIIGPHGEEYKRRNRVTLCRCGESKNMPFCNGSHYDCDKMKGFDD